MGGKEEVKGKGPPGQKAWAKAACFKHVLQLLSEDC